MSTDRNPLWQLLDALQMNHRTMGAQIVELRARIANLDIPNPEMTTCSHCGPMPGGLRTLAEHLYTSHDGPEPEHWRNHDANLEPVGADA